MVGLLDFLIAYYVTKRVTKRAYSMGDRSYNSGLEQMQRVREIARRARLRREHK